MYQIDVSTAASVQPPPSAAGTPGFFTDGDLTAGQAPTIVPAEFLNALMLEVLNVVTGAGITPTKATNNQLLAAVKALAAQLAVSSATIATTGGTTTLSATQAGSSFVIVTGALTANATLVFPNAPQRWTVINNTTGNFTLNCATQLGQGVTVTQGRADTIVTDGVNVDCAIYDAPLRPYGDSSNALASTLYVDRAVAQVGGYYQDTGSVPNAYVVSVMNPPSAELVPNGTFNTDLSGWTSSSSYASTAADVSGEMQVTPTALYGRQVTSTATTSGKTYNISATVRRVSGATGSVSFGVCDSQGHDLTAFATTATNTPTVVSLQYTATAAITYLQAGTAVSTDVVAGFDNVSVKQAPDHAVSFRFRTTRANTGGVVVDFGAGFVPLKTEQGNALAAGDIPTGSIVSVTFDPALGYAVVNEMVLSQLGALAKEGFGQGLEDDGAGNARVKLADSSIRRSASGIQTNDPITPVAASQSIAAANHGSTLEVTGAAVTLTAPATSTLWNGYNVTIDAQGGPVTFAPNAADKVAGGAAGASYSVLQGQSVNLVTDGAGNWRTLFQSTPVGSFSPRYITASVALSAGTYLVDTTAGPVTVTLPANPSTGTCLDFTDAAAMWSINPLTLNGNGKTIFGSTDPLICDISGECFKIWFNGSDWRLF